jgi:hypothetical protein
LIIAMLAVGGSASISRAADDEKDFTPLFTGRDLSGWRVGSATKNRWKVTSDRVLENAWTKDHPSTDLISEKTFWNFTLRLDFLVHQGGNSGVYLRGRHEIQLIDDDTSRQLSAVSNGAIFNQVSPSTFASRPSGEWQTLEATMVGHTITVLLNGKKIHDRVPCPKPTDKPLDTKVNSPGPILLQGRLGEVKFRNVRLKVLP